MAATLPASSALGAASRERHVCSHWAAVAAELQTLLVQVGDDAGNGIGEIGVQMAKDNPAGFGRAWRASHNRTDTGCAAAAAIDVLKVEAIDRPGTDAVAKAARNAIDPGVKCAVRRPQPIADDTVADLPAHIRIR